MSKQASSILVIDDDKGVLTSAKLLLKSKFDQVETCDNPEKIPDLLKNTACDVILLDMNFTPGECNGVEGLYWLSQIKLMNPEAVVIMMTAYGEVDIAVQALKGGACDFIMKPWDNSKLLAKVSEACSFFKPHNNVETFNSKNQSSIENNEFSIPNIIGQSKSLLNAIKIVGTASSTDANILILGESGTGKRLIAEEIHQYSQRKDSPFVSIDLSSISESLFESELFGHQKESFDGVNQTNIGRIQAANGGTLFLDEIGNLPMHLQAKLFNVLALQEVTPIGSDYPIPINVRVITVTNLSQSQLLDKKNFCQDLLYQLNTIEVSLPPLRERTEDIPLIVEHYLNIYANKYNRSKLTVLPEAMRALQLFSWPGNIRELRHSIERAVILSDDTHLGINDFPLITASTRVNSYEILNLNDIEKRTIESALNKHTGNISHAARDLGLSRAALYRRIEKHAL